MSKSQGVWLITGCSRGLGRTLAEAVLAQGGSVVATARDAATLATLVAQAPDRVCALALDVNDPAACTAAVGTALKTFGGIDVLVNNAGYGLFAGVEEASDAETREQMETNVFGVLNVCRAALPAMRAARRGHLLQISSIAGLVATPGLGIYNASKFALEGLSEALALELAPFGIAVTIIEPGPFRTDWAGNSLARASQPLPDYAETLAATRHYFETAPGHQAGDPVRAAAAMIAAVNAEKPPLRLPLGKIALTRIRDKAAKASAELAAWEATTLGADFPAG